MTSIDAPWLTSETSQKICAAFVDRGFQIFFVGGCVRNQLLGQPVSDLDLATDATPDEVLDLASALGIKAIPTGIDHGTVTLVSEQIPYEVTTFRHDIETDGRQAKVSFTRDLKEDAKRRDFTMNALYADARGGVIDPVSGLADLNTGIVRFIGEPKQRIEEDYLRILRFFRFHAWYSDPEAGIEPDGLAACAAHADQIPFLSKERITAEFLKILSAPDPSLAVGSMAASGVLMHTLPGASAQALAPYVYLETANGIAINPLARLAALGGDPTQALRLSKLQQTSLDKLNRRYASPFEIGFRLGDLAVENLALSAAQMGQEIDTNWINDAKIGAQSTFPVRADDLMPELTGKALGDRLKELEKRWIASEMKLTKDDLLA